MNKKYISRVIVGLCLMGFSSLGMSTTISYLNTTLTGDIRYSDINDLSVDVNIAYSGITADWEVDLSPLNTSYPGAKLQAFFFNLNTDWDNIAVSNINTGWALVSTTKQSEGSGGAFFDYIGDNQGSGDVDTTNPLSFTLTQLGWTTDDGREDHTALDWSDGMFTNAYTETGDAGSGQLGAHIGGLENGCSAFLMGNYDGSPNSGSAPSDLQACSSDVPEPSVIALFAIGLFGLGLALRRQG